MSEPRVYGREPMILDLEPGTYYWCACGQSDTQPFCNGAHQGGDFQPLRFEVELPGRKALCLCKHTARAPHCDGSHTSL